MPMRRIACPRRALLLCGLALVLLAATAALAQQPGVQAASVRSWLFYSGAEIAPKDYAAFDVVALDGFRHPKLEHAAPGRPLILGCLSVGEARKDGPTWVLVNGQDFVLGTTPWGAAILDLRSAKWQTILLDIIVPKLLAQGFDGLLIDAVDAGLALERGKNPARYAGMRVSALDFLLKLRSRHPNIRLALNRGLDLLPEAAPLLNYLVIEDFSSEFSYAVKDYRPVDKAVRAALDAVVGKARQSNPGLTVLTLDYARPDQEKVIAGAIDAARSRGYVPYVGTESLDMVFRQTLSR